MPWGREERKREGGGGGREGGREGGRKAEGSRISGGAGSVEGERAQIWTLVVVGGDVEGLLCWLRQGEHQVVPLVAIGVSEQTIKFDGSEQRALLFAL